MRSLYIAAAFNNVAATPAAATDRGGLNVWRNSAAAEEFAHGQLLVVAGVPFSVPQVWDGRPDNIRAAAQRIAVPAGRYDWVHVLATGERRVEDELAMLFEDGAVDLEPIRVSDFWSAPSVFSEEAALRSARMHYPGHVQAGVPATVWCQRVPVTRRATLVGVRLPDNPALHVFAMTAHSVEGTPDGGR